MAIAKKRKKFFEVELPLIKRTTQLQAFELKELKDRLIKYDLTRILKGKSSIIQLKVKTNEEGTEATSVPREFKIFPYYLRRMMRKGTNYVEDSFSAECKDAQLKIKPFMITRRRVSRAVRKALRNKAREELIKYVEGKTSEKIFEEILRNSLQKTLSLALKKIYPLSLCEIRVLKVEKDLEVKEKPKKEPKAKNEDSENKTESEE